MIEYAIPVKFGDISSNFSSKDTNIPIRIKAFYLEKPDKTYLYNIVDNNAKIMVSDEVGKYEINCKLLFKNNEMALVKLMATDIASANFSLHLFYDDNVDAYLIVNTLEKDVIAKK